MDLQVTQLYCGPDQYNMLHQAWRHFKKFAADQQLRKNQNRVIAGVPWTSWKGSKHLISWEWFQKDAIKTLNTQDKYLKDHNNLPYKSACPIKNGRRGPCPCKTNH